VTVTSDGKNTIKRTVTVVDGIEKVVTETTDENGKTTRRESGSVEAKEPAGPWMGIRVKGVSEILRGQLDLSDDEGLVVELVASGGPSEKAGIRKGDLLLALGESAVSTSAELAKELQKLKTGDTAGATIMRKGKRSTVDIELGAPPAMKGGNAPKSLTEGLEKRSAKSVDIAVDGADISAVFDSVLDDPSLPNSFKESVRGMQKMLRDFEKDGAGTKAGKDSSRK